MREIRHPSQHQTEAYSTQILGGAQRAQWNTSTVRYTDKTRDGWWRDLARKTQPQMYTVKQLLSWNDLHYLDTGDHVQRWLGMRHEEHRQIMCRYLASLGRVMVGDVSCELVPHPTSSQEVVHIRGAGVLKLDGRPYPVIDLYQWEMQLSEMAWKTRRTQQTSANLMRDSHVVVSLHPDILDLLVGWGGPKMNTSSVSIMDQHALMYDHVAIMMGDHRLQYDEMYALDYAGVMELATVHSRAQFGAELFVPSAITMERVYPVGLDVGVRDVYDMFRAEGLDVETAVAAAERI